MYWMLTFKVSKSISLKTGRMINGIITVQRLIAASTEIEAIERFKSTLKANEKYLSHENITIQ